MKVRESSSQVERKTLYCWRLTEADKTPSGKRDDISLREKIKQIQKDLNSNITPDGGNFTVLELVQKYFSQKTGVRHNTRSNYNFVVNVIKKKAFGQKRIDKIKVSDAKAWLIKMQQVDGRGYSSIHTIRGAVRPAFQMAVDDNLILKNPFEFELGTVIVNDNKNRQAIQSRTKRSFLTL